MGNRGTPPKLTNRRWTDVADLLDNGLPDAPEPEFLRRTDGKPLFYAGQFNLVFGDPESGKTLVALAAGAETLNRGQKLAVLDLDHNGPVATICRLIDMGVDESILRNPNRFRYCEPEDRTHLLAAVAEVKAWKPDMVTVDSIGELVPMMKGGSNSPDDFTAVHRATLKPMAMAGACVVAIDHLPKNVENKANGPTGTVAKRRAVGGVAIRVTVDAQFTPGKGGKSCLTINKDRHGGLRRHCPVEAGKEPIAGWFKVEPKDDVIEWIIDPPVAGDTAPRSRVDPRDLAALNALEPPPKSVRDVKDRCKWSSNRAMAVLAEWRSQRSRSVPEEQGTPGVGRADGDFGGVPRFPTYVPGNGEHDGPQREVLAPKSTCSCGQELLLKTPGRTVCERCRLAKPAA